MRRKGTAHLAGIIPVTQSAYKFKMDWHDSLMPIAPGYTAIEHSVLECAMAGCHTIWIAAAENTTPLIRHRLGDYVQDPVFLGRKNRFPQEIVGQYQYFIYQSWTGKIQHCGQLCLAHEQSQRSLVLSANG